MVDVNNKEGLEKWLQGQPREVSIVIAVRAALRVLPFLDELPTGTNKKTNNIILSVFRIMIFPWATVSYPYIDRELKVASRNARGAFFLAMDNRKTLDNRTSTYVVRAARAAFDTHSSRTVRTASFATRSIFATFVTDLPINSTLRETLDRDVSLIENNKSPQDIAQSALWHENPPVKITNNWQNLKIKLLALNEDWQVWTDWYEARLYGKPEPIEKLEIARATIDEEI